MDNYVQNFLKENLKDPVIIEAGMCWGGETKLFCEMFPNGKVYGFEPIPYLFERSKSMVDGFTNVEVFQKALSDKTGKTSMYVANIDGGICESSSLLAPKVHLTYHPQIKFEENIEVDAINLDEFVEQKGLERIDLMWLDLQGYEPLVLQSSLKALRMTKYLYTEINILEVYENVVKWPEFYNFLVENGFQKIYDDIFFPRDAANALLVNTNIK
jgi:FkbM family methyltransferase